MKNKTKRTIVLSDIKEIFISHKLGTPVEMKALSGGEFNSVYKVFTDKGSSYAIKISPAKNVSVLTYEKDIILSEKFALEHFKDNAYVHIPEVIAFGETAEVGKYLIIEFVAGKMLLKTRLSADEYNQVMYDLGKAIAGFHDIACDLGFGYLQNGLKTNWKSAYLSMVDNIINDARKVNARIPYISEIHAAIDSCKDILNEVQNSSVLHFDLWAGNLFILDNKLHAIIDCERMMLGDPVGDFIHLNYTAPFDIQKNKYLIDGYNSTANNKLSFNRNELIRFYLMRLYLGLIAYVETYYRMSKFSPVFYGKKIFAKKVLRVSLCELNKLMKGK